MRHLILFLCLTTWLHAEYAAPSLQDLVKDSKFIVIAEYSKEISNTYNKEFKSLQSQKTLLKIKKIIKGKISTSEIIVSSYESNHICPIAFFFPTKKQSYLLFLDSQTGNTFSSKFDSMAVFPIQKDYLSYFPRSSDKPFKCKLISIPKVLQKIKDEIKKQESTETQKAR